jgi:hypothetical protein
MAFPGVIDNGLRIQSSKLKFGHAARLVSSAFAAFSKRMSGRRLNARLSTWRNCVAQRNAVLGSEHGIVSRVISLMISQPRVEMHASFADGDAASLPPHHQLVQNISHLVQAGLD